MSVEQFGQYRLEELIGRGGMGEVYRAYDTVRERRVAVKRLPANLASDAEFQARFRKESALASRLAEAHIIPIHDFGEIDGRLFIDMRLVEGRDLAAVIGQEGRIGVARVASVATQVASALDAAHADGLVHRDVKPSNVLLTGRTGHEFVYLVDFGIARSIGGSPGTSLTVTGATVGTLDYMAPERFLEARSDHRVDVYALACLCYEALTGRPPFSGEGLPAMINAHLNVAPPRPGASVPGLPVGVDEVIVAGMAKRPEDRYDSAGEFADALADAAAGPPAPGPAPAVETRLGTPGVVPRPSAGFGPPPVAPMPGPDPRSASPYPVAPGQPAAFGGAPYSSGPPAAPPYAPPSQGFTGYPAPAYGPGGPPGPTGSGYGQAQQPGYGRPPVPGAPGPYGHPPPSGPARWPWVLGALAAVLVIVIVVVALVVAPPGGDDDLAGPTTSPVTSETAAPEDRGARPASLGGGDQIADQQLWDALGGDGIVWTGCSYAEPGNARSRLGCDNVEPALALQIGFRNYATPVQLEIDRAADQAALTGSPGTCDAGGRFAGRVGAFDLVCGYTTYTDGTVYYQISWSSPSLLLRGVLLDPDPALAWQWYTGHTPFS